MAACELPELAVTVTEDTPIGVATLLFMGWVLPALPQPNPATTSKSKVAIARRLLVRQERCFTPAKTIPITVNPYQNPPMPPRAPNTLATVFVLILTVTWPGSAPGLSEEGLNRQVALAGNPAQLKVIADTSVPFELMLRLKLPTLPAGTVKAVWDKVSAN